MFTRSGILLNRMPSVLGSFLAIAYTFVAVAKAQSDPDWCQAHQIKFTANTNTGNQRGQTLKLRCSWHSSNDECSTMAYSIKYKTTKLCEASKIPYSGDKELDEQSGRSRRLKCKITGTRVDGRLELNITSLTRQDNGKYYCFARNEAYRRTFKYVPFNTESKGEVHVNIPVTTTTTTTTAITTTTEAPKKSKLAYLALLIPILLGAIIAIYYYYRRRKRATEQIIDDDDAPGTEPKTVRSSTATVSRIDNLAQSLDTAAGRVRTAPRSMSVAGIVENLAQGLDTAGGKARASRCTVKKEARGKGRGKRSRGKARR